MKYIIDMIDDLQENVGTTQDYTLVAMLVEESEDGTLRNKGEKRITSFSVDHNAKAFYLSFADEEATTANLLRSANALEMDAMMYEVKVKISDAYPLMPVIGFAEEHGKREYIFFVTT